MSKIDDLWAQAARDPGVPVDIGDMVVCDLCDEDFTDRPDTGGLIFLSTGCCPDCAPRFLATIKACGEELMIRAHCPAGQSFAAFVVAYRGGNNTIQITKSL